MIHVRLRIPWNLTPRRDSTNARNYIRSTLICDFASIRNNFRQASFLINYREVFAILLINDIARLHRNKNDYSEGNLLQARLSVKLRREQNKESKEKTRKKCAVREWKKPRTNRLKFSHVSLAWQFSRICRVRSNCTLNRVTR